MEDFQFHRRGVAAAAAPLPGKVATGARGKPPACYDEMFGGQQRYAPAAPPSLVPSRPEDYRGIFGAANACSIPVLDLPPPGDGGYEFRQCSALDYLDIFGGFDGHDFAVSYEELFASQVSHGIGTPLPSELDVAPTATNTSNSRELKRVGCVMQGMPAPGVIIEGPSGDQIEFSLNGVARHLNDGTNRSSTSNHMASVGGKNDPVNGTIHKNQVCASPGFDFVVDTPHTLEDVDIFLDSNCGEEMTEEQHHMKTVLPASSCGDVKYSRNDMKADEKSSPLELSGSVNAPAFEQNASHSSKNQSAVSNLNGLSTWVSINNSPNENFMEKKTEGNCQNKTVPTVMNASLKNDLKDECSASEDVPASEENLSSSFVGHSPSSGAKSFPDCLANDTSINAVNIGTSEANNFQKSMSGSPPYTSPRSSEENKTAEQEMSNSMPSHPKNVPINASQHSRSCSTHSTSSSDRLYPGGVFLTVSDINLRTVPSQGPPPSRPPPARPPFKSGISGRSLHRTLTDYRDHDARSEIAYKSHSFKHAARDGSPPTFDVEVDAGSAAAASVAAIKEAMELAHARLKSAKVSMERKKDNLQGRRKLGSNEGLKNTIRHDDETTQENQQIREVVAQVTSGKTDGKGNVFAAEKMVTASSASKLTANSMEREGNCGSAEQSPQTVYQREAGLSNLPNKKEEKFGEWKVEKQFYELIQNGKEFQKVPETSLNEGTDKRSNASFGTVAEELSASELRKNENLLAASRVVELEGDSDVLQDPILTGKGRIKDSQKPTGEFYMERECVPKLKETIAHYQEKKPGEAQELCETEPEAKWRTSKEAFIYELSEKDLRGMSDPFKCKSVREHQGQNKTQKVSEGSCLCEETAKEKNVIEKHLECQVEEKDNKVWGRLSELDENRKEAKVTHVLHVPIEGTHLKTANKGHENADQEIEPKEARLLSGQDNRKMSNVTHPAFEWAENKNELKSAVEIYGWTGNKESLVHKTNGCSGKTNELKDSQEFSIETEKAPPVKVAKQNAFSTTGIMDDLLDDIIVALGDYKRKSNENIKEVHIVVDSNKEMKSVQDACEQTGNGNKKGDAQQTISLGEQWHMCTAVQVSSQNRDAGWSFENDTECHVRGEDVDKGKMESELARNLEEKKREARRLEEKERDRMRLEEEREGKQMELEEKEREMQKLEEAKRRERRKLEEEKESERRKLEQEQERERRILEEEERKRGLLEEKEERERERKKFEEERRKSEEEERQRRRSEEEERERSKLEEEKKRRKMEEERERKKLEEEERRKIVEAERKRKKQEEEDMERIKLEEKEKERREQEEERERQRLEDVERERRKLEEKVRERRIAEVEKEKKLEEVKMRERQKIVEEKVREKKSEEKEREWRKIEDEKERERIKLEEDRGRERERGKDRQAVERATREAHERAFAEARERAERAAVERVTAEARQRALIEARDRAEKVSAEALEKSMAEKASREARLRAERAAVERATAEARERAVEKALAEKAAQDARERAEKLATTSRDGVKQNANFSNNGDSDLQLQSEGISNNSYQRHSDSSNHAPFTNEKFGGSEGESAIRSKARMERHQRTVERAAKALAEKNLRDIIAQREQAERNRLAETLDADVKRWSNGKEGNLRALLSTLQYILGPESGWQPIPLTDVVTAPGVKKAYRKATLCVHPDKLQQRGASIQQKYICEKVFDLLKEAWNKFNSEER